jgi:hypothetical protein
VRLQHGFDADVLTEQPANDLRHVLDDRIDAERLDAKHLSFAERQQLAREGRGALRRAKDLGDILPPRIVRLEASRDEIGEPANRREKIVEVVRHAAGELADRVHLLRLANLLLEAAALGNVT